jgi:hypothetical protein
VNPLLLVKATTFLCRKGNCNRLFSKFPILVKLGFSLERQVFFVDIYMSKAEYIPNDLEFSRTVRS